MNTFISLSFRSTCRILKCKTVRHGLADKWASTATAASTAAVLALDYTALFKFGLRNSTNTVGA